MKELKKIPENPNFHLSVRDYIAAYMQFYEGTNVERFNQITAELFQLDCP